MIGIGVTYNKIQGASLVYQVSKSHQCTVPVTSDRISPERTKRRHTVSKQFRKCSVSVSFQFCFTQCHGPVDWVWTGNAWTWNWRAWLAVGLVEGQVTEEHARGWLTER